MELRERRKPIISVEKVRSFDAFDKVEYDFKKPTTTGGTSMKEFLCHFFKLISFYF
jgi:hypothetical protein